MQIQDIARELCDAVDWDRPELSGQVFAQAHRLGDDVAAVLGLIRHLRQRENPRLGYSRDYLKHLRRSATQEQIAAAGRRFDAAFERDLLMPYHGNAFAALGAETVLLAATPDRCRLLAERVRESQPRWREGYWGVTNRICDLLRYLWPVEECADADLVPVFGWLLAKADVEWRSARTWDEKSLGSSGHNWWAHTFLGFWMLGVFFPEFKGCGRFAALSGDYLERELRVLFEDDGWSKEGSPGYNDFASNALMGFAHLASLNGFPLPEMVLGRLRVMADASWKVVLPDGDYPVFGDHVRVGAYAGFHGQDLSECRTTAMLRRRSARFGLPETKYVAEALDPDWHSPYGDMLPDEGQDLMSAYRALVAKPPVSCDTSLPRSGCYVMRQDWTSQADCMVINAGIVGPRITSHKHADIFGFELYARGRRLLVDNWYGPVADEREDAAVRMWRVGSSAHNVATVDGADHVPVVREFLFGGTVIPTVDDWRSEDAFAYFSGVHEGYLRAPIHVPGVRRKVFYLRGQYWILIDRFTAGSDAEHLNELHFHLNVPAELGADGRVVTRGSGGNLLIHPVGGADGTAELVPNPYPVEGYENPQHLSYARRKKGNDLFVTLLVPFEDGSLPEVSASLLDVESDERQLSAWEATALAISINGRRDVYFDQHMHWNLPWSAGGYSSSERLFHSAVHTASPRA